MGILDLIFPKTCVGCGRLGSYLCEACLNKLELIKFQKCPMCERSSISGVVHKNCHQPRVGMDGLTSVLAYRGTTRKLVSKLKFGFVTDLYDPLVELIVTFGEFQMVANNNWSVVGVPLHVSRERWRGFNQAEGLAQKLAAYFGWSYLQGLLVRTKRTKEQQKLKRKDRSFNVDQAFSINPKLITHNSKLTNILLVDDVWTTGATMRECARVLKKAGARKVWGLTLAA